VHVCSFAVDTLPGGDFGIICVCHPMPHPGPATAALRKVPASVLPISSDESKTA
jgi:hypothetical protein